MARPSPHSAAFPVNIIAFNERRSASHEKQKNPLASSSFLIAFCTLLELVVIQQTS